MAFCKYCGTKLEDGQNCTCEAAVAAASKLEAANQAVTAPKVETPVENTVAVEAAVTTPVAEQAPVAETVSTTAAQTTPATVAPSITLPKVNVDKEMVNGIVNQYLSILKAPATGSAAFMTGENTIPAAVIVAIQAILSGIISMFYVGKINKVFSVASSFINMDKYKFSGFKAFVLSIFFSLLFAAIFASIMFVVAKILKLEMDIKQAFELAAIRASYLIPVTAIAIILSILNVQISVGIYVTGSVFALGFILAAMISKYPEKANVLVYVVTAAIFIFVLLMAGIMAKCGTIYVPSSIKKDMGDLSSLASYFM